LISSALPLQKTDGDAEMINTEAK
jgi:hypothetical protein